MLKQILSIYSLSGDVLYNFQPAWEVLYTFTDFKKPFENDTQLIEAFGLNEELYEILSDNFNYTLYA